MTHQFSDNGDRITPVLDLPLSLRVLATRVDYEPGGTTEWPHRHLLAIYMVPEGQAPAVEAAAA